MVDNDERARMHDWVLQKSSANRESNAGESSRQSAPPSPPDGGGGELTGCGSGRVCSGGPSPVSTAGVAPMSTNRHQYVETLKGLVDSLAGGRIAMPVITAMHDGLLHVTTDSINCPPLAEGLCSDTQNHKIEAIRIAKYWWCIVIATQPPQVALRWVGALSLGTDYD